MPTIKEKIATFHKLYDVFPKTDIISSSDSSSNIIGLLTAEELLSQDFINDVYNNEDVYHIKKEYSFKTKFEHISESKIISNTRAIYVYSILMERLIDNGPYDAARKLIDKFQDTSLAELYNKFLSVSPETYTALLKENNGFAYSTYLLDELCGKVFTNDSTGVTNFINDISDNIDDSKLHKLLNIVYSFKVKENEDNDICMRSYNRRSSYTIVENLIGKINKILSVIYNSHPLETINKVSKQINKTSFTSLLSKLNMNGRLTQPSLLFANNAISEEEQVKLIEESITKKDALNTTYSNLHSKLLKDEITFDNLNRIIDNAIIKNKKIKDRYFPITKDRIVHTFIQKVIIGSPRDHGEVKSLKADSTEVENFIKKYYDYLFDFVWLGNLLCSNNLVKDNSWSKTSFTKNVLALFDCLKQYLIKYPDTTITTRFSKALDKIASHERLSFDESYSNALCCHNIVVVYLELVRNKNYISAGDESSSELANILYENGDIMLMSYLTNSSIYDCKTLLQLGLCFSGNEENLKKYPNTCYEHDVSNNILCELTRWSLSSSGSVYNKYNFLNGISLLKKSAIEGPGIGLSESHSYRSNYQAQSCEYSSLYNRHSISIIVNNIIAFAEYIKLDPEKILNIKEFLKLSKLLASKSFLNSGVKKASTAL